VKKHNIGTEWYTNHANIYPAERLGSYRGHDSFCRTVCLYGYLIEIPSPSLQGVVVIKKEDKLLHSMIEPTLETEKVIPLNVDITEEQENSVPFLEEEIECPRCHDSMMLCSDFDNLFYVCQECDFCLYTIKKAAS
jgi:hypothetical protein